MHVIFKHFLSLVLYQSFCCGFLGELQDICTNTDRGLPMWFPRPTVKVVPFPSRAVSVFMVTYGHE